MNNLERMSELREQLGILHTELSSLEAAERDRRNNACVGNCYRYRNSGGSESESWWLYLKVLRAEGGHLRAHKFEIRPSGFIGIEPDDFVFREIGAGYEQIAEREFYQAWTGCQELVASLPKPVVR